MRKKDPGLSNFTKIGKMIQIYCRCLNPSSKEVVMDERIEILLQENLAVQKEILIELRAKNEIKQIDSYCSWRRCGICTVISIVIITASGIAAAFGVVNK
jgi:hypothetical protein